MVVLAAENDQAVCSRIEHARVKIPWNASATHFLRYQHEQAYLGIPTFNFGAMVTDEDSGEAEHSFRTEAERHSGMIPNTIGA